MHVITCTVVQWADVFTRNVYISVVEHSLNFCIEKKGLVVYGYVIMSNPIHVGVQAKDNNLSDVERDFKRVTSRQITKAMEANTGESRKRWLLWWLTSEKATEKEPAAYRFWQPGNGAELCCSLPFMWQKLAYIHNNPVRAEMVGKADEYKSSPAADYFYGKPVRCLKMEWLDAMVVTV